MQGTAHHEAGHAVAGVLVGIRVEKVFIFADSPGDMYQGECVMDASSITDLSRARQDPRSRRWVQGQFRKEIISVFGSPVAETKFLGITLDADGLIEVPARLKRYRFGHPQDINTTFDLAIRSWPRTSSDKRRDLLEETTILIEEHWRAVCLIAERLLEKRQLSGAEVQELLARAGC